MEEVQVLLSTLILMVESIIGGLSLECYTCTSMDLKSCESSQQVVKCPYEKALCKTQGYSIMYSEGKRNVFLKQCVKYSEQCEKCSGDQPGYVENCVARCCNTDLCNQRKSSDKELFSKQRRSSIHSNSLQCTTGYMTILITTCLTIFLCIRR